MYPTRRTFLGATASALALPGALETINVGCIGTGGRCQALMRSLGAIDKAMGGSSCGTATAR